MRILFDNVNFESRSGPNSFGLKLARAISARGHTLVDPHESPDVQLAFIQSTGRSQVPLVQRLDGIWFNSAQDWKQQNVPIRATYDRARSVVFQSDFDRKLVEKFFGPHPDGHVIRNGTDRDLIMKHDPLYVPQLIGVNKVWTCASSWRPHKRLRENIRYFMEHAGMNDFLVIAGANPDVRVADPRIGYVGDLDHQLLMSLYRASDYFIHLAWLDHCPNVVVDARSAGAHIICSSSGGTREVAGPDATVVQEDEWDFEPCELYNPPPMDFSRRMKNDYDVSLDIHSVSLDYERVLLGERRERE